MGLPPVRARLAARSRGCHAMRPGPAVLFPPRMPVATRSARAAAKATKSAAGILVCGIAERRGTGAGSPAAGSVVSIREFSPTEDDGGDEQNRREREGPPADGFERRRLTR